MTEVVSRDHDGGHTCVCVMVTRLGDRDMCGGWVESPDQPFCVVCTSHGHEPQADPVEVAARIRAMARTRP